MKSFFFTALLCITILITVAGCSRQQDMTWQEQYDLGVRYLSEGNYEDAIIAFNAAIEIEPNSIETYLELAKAYEANGNIHSAELTLKTAKILSTDENIRLEIENKLNEIADFAEGTDGVDETDPNDEETSAQMDYLALAKEKIASDDLDGAIAILEDGYEQTDDTDILKQLCAYRLDRKLAELVDKYGWVSTKPKERRIYGFNDLCWTGYDGIVSAGECDLDDDGFVELILVRTKLGTVEGGTKAISLLIEVYCSDSSGVNNAGSFEVGDYDDTGDGYLAVYLHEVNGEKYVMVEDFSDGYFVDSWSRSYTALKYIDKAVSVTMKIKQSDGGSSDIAESMYLYDKNGFETEIVLKADGFAIVNKGTEGKYASSDNIYRDALMDFGFEYPPEYVDGFFPSYLNSPTSYRLCRLYSNMKLSTNGYGTNQTAVNMTCGIDDFTGLRD